MKKLICVILVLGVCGCAQNGQGKGQKSGFPVQVTSQEQGGLPVEIMADEGKLRAIVGAGAFKVLARVSRLSSS